MRTLFFFILILSAFAQYQCGSPKSTSDQGLSKELLIKYYAGACRGYCPHFVIQFFKDRSVMFEGRRNVEYDGDTTFQMSPEEYAILNEVVASADLENADSNYLEAIMDIPTRIFTFYRGGKEKSIRFNTRIPKSLETLELAIIAYTREQGLVGRNPDNMISKSKNEVEYIVQVEKESHIDQLITDLAPNKVLIIRKLAPNLNYYLIKYYELNQRVDSVIEKIKKLDYVIEVQVNKKVNERQ